MAKNHLFTKMDHLLKCYQRKLHFKDFTEALDGGGMGDRGHKTQMFEGQGGHKTKTARGHLTLDFLDSEGQGTPN